MTTTTRKPKRARRDPLNDAIRLIAALPDPAFEAAQACISATRSLEQVRSAAKEIDPA